MIIECYSLRIHNPNKVHGVVDINDVDAHNKILSLFTDYKLHMVELIAEVDANIPLWWRLQYTTADGKICLSRDYTDRPYLQPIQYYEFGDRALSMFSRIDNTVTDKFVDLINLLQEHDLSYYARTEVPRLISESFKDSDNDSSELPF